MDGSHYCLRVSDTANTYAGVEPVVGFPLQARPRGREFRRRPIPGWCPSEAIRPRERAPTNPKILF